MYEYILEPHNVTIWKTFILMIRVHNVSVWQYNKMIGPYKSYCDHIGLYSGV